MSKPPDTPSTDTSELEQLMIECRHNQIGNEGWLETKFKIEHLIASKEAEAYKNGYVAGGIDEHARNNLRHQILETAIKKIKEL